MNTQPIALRLADELENYGEFQSYFDGVAAELRRLHEVNQELLAALKQSLEALEYYADLTEDPSTASGAALIASAAIAKATGETN